MSKITKKDCMFCPCCRKSKNFEEHQALVCAITAQNETNFEVGAFSHVPKKKKCRWWVQSSFTTSPSLRDSTFFLCHHPQPAALFLPVSRSGLVSKMRRPHETRQKSSRPSFCSSLIMPSWLSLENICLHSGTLFLNSQKLVLLTLCSNHTPFNTDVLACLSARMVTN